MVPSVQEFPAVRFVEQRWNGHSRGRGGMDGGLMGSTVLDARGESSGNELSTKVNVGSFTGVYTWRRKGGKAAVTCN